MIIPSVNCRDFNEAAVQLKKIASFLPPTGGWVHIDVADGVFAAPPSWGDPEELLNLRRENLKLNFEVHLMVENPEEVIEQWLKTGVKRVIIHFEAMKDPRFLLEIAKQYGATVMLATNPATPIETTRPYFESFTEFQILAVPPGPSGQKFDAQVLEKIKFLRQRLPDATIEADGGINPETAKLAKEAGANILVSAAYIMNSPDPKGAYEELLETLKSG